MRFDPVLLIALCALGGATLAVAPGPALFAAGAGIALACRRLALAPVLAAVLVLGVGALRARSALDRFEARHARARAALGEPRRCRLVARVESSPARVGGVMGWIGEIEHADCEGRAIPIGARARLYGGPEELCRNDRLELVAQLAPVELARNLGLPDPTPSAARRGAVLSGMVLGVEEVERRGGLGALIDRARNRARRRIDATFVPAAAPLARALVLGETDLDPADNDAFRRSGLAHLLAVSGTHLVLAVATLVRVLSALFVRIEWLAVRIEVGRIAAALGIPLALGYADFAGGSGSAWRAAVMLAAAYFARAFARHPRPTRTLALSLLLGVLADPLTAFDLSFLLSAAATAGLIVLSRPLGAPFRRVRFRPLAWLFASLVTTLSAMLPCIPLLALMAPSVTLAGVFANVVAAPIGELVALPLCLVHPLTELAPPLERGTALVASGALLAVRAVAHAAASVRVLAVELPAPNGWHLATLAVALLGAWSARRRLGWLFLGLAGLALVELWTVRAGSPRDALGVAVLDVGQGDALLADLPDGTLMLIDGGGSVGSPVDPGKSVILPLLRARRRSRVDIMVLTHAHPDHLTGLLTVARGMVVGELWHGGESVRPGSAYAALLDELAQRGVKILGPAELCPAPRRFGPAVARVLGPCPAPDPARGSNDNSLVLRLELGSRAALLVGDAEEAEERVLRAGGANLRADLLKVGHHGSRTSSSPPFLDRVAPTHAVISCGVRNRFGHPHPETLAELGRREIHILRTDLVGSVLWQTNGAATRLERAVDRSD